MKTTSRTIRTSKLDLILSPEAKQTLNSAETLTARKHFHLNAEQWEVFMAALEEAPRTVPQLQKLFREPSPFDMPEAK